MLRREKLQGVVGYGEMLSRAYYLRSSSLFSYRPFATICGFSSAPLQPLPHTPNVGRVLPFHERTQHSFQEYPHGLQCAHQPNPSPRHAGFSTGALHRCLFSRSPPDQMAFAGFMEFQISTKAAVSQLFCGNCAVSGSLRANPNSGNLHPTEVYFVSGAMEGINEKPFSVDYCPQKPACTIRGEKASDLWVQMEKEPPNDVLSVGLTTAHGFRRGILVRNSDHVQVLWEALRHDSTRHKPEKCPLLLALYQLFEADCETLATKLTCFQPDLGKSGCFTLAMIAPLDDTREQGSWMHPQLHWDCGALGQLHFLHESGISRIGCYFNDPGYNKKPIFGKGLLTTPFNRDIHGSTFGIECHSRASRFCTSKPALTATSKWEMKARAPSMLEKTVGKNGISWQGCRWFTSDQNLESSALELQNAVDSKEAEGNDVSALNEANIDFRNFPALQSSTYENYERPQQMMPCKARMPWKHRYKFSGAEKKFTVDAIPPPKGPMYDFGFGNSAIKPPPLKAGARPQGGFDIHLSFSESEVHACESSSINGQSQPQFPDRRPCLETSKETGFVKDGNSEVSDEFCDDEGFFINEDGDFQIREDGGLDSEQDFLWDPFNASE